MQELLIFGGVDDIQYWFAEIRAEECFLNILFSPARPRL